MVGENLTETWFASIWKSSRKSISREPERQSLGILAFEISRLMSKLVNMWQFLTDRQILRLREEIANSVGIGMLVSRDEGYLMDLAFSEIIENLSCVAKSVALLGKKCADPIYHNLETVFDNPFEIDPKWCVWQYRLKKMEKKIKKMEKFVAATEQMYPEIEVLAELEQSLRRMRAGASSAKVKLLEFQQKVLWQRQEVRNLREMSPWVRTYDYIVRLLLRSLFTIIERIKCVYGVEGNDNFAPISGDCLVRNDSMQENSASRISVGRSFSSLGFGGENSKSKSKKQHFSKSGRFGATGCMTGGSESPVAYIKDVCNNKTCTKVSSLFNSMRIISNAPQSTLGYAALHLHYANVIILIEKLSSSPHLISLDARDDLYGMLPSTLRNCLRAKLRVFSRNLVSGTGYDADLAAEWGLAIARVLEWLSPLAHNMIRWQSERNFERQRFVYGSNVLLVQTLYFADRVETEAVIVELLMGVNYLFRFGRRIDETPYRESSCNRAAYDGYLFPRGDVYCNMIDDNSIRELS
ncbi:hypothetical protein ACP275_10G096600 [Erythranthe tilingii]